MRKFLPSSSLIEEEFQCTCIASPDRWRRFFLSFHSKEEEASFTPNPRFRRVYVTSSSTSFFFEIERSSPLFPPLTLHAFSLGVAMPDSNQLESLHLLLCRFTLRKVSLFALEGCIGILFPVRSPGLGLRVLFSHPSSFFLLAAILIAETCRGPGRQSHEPFLPLFAEHIL